jgi:hypothetical protein
VLGEYAADRLGAAEAAPVLVDERYERRYGRSSSAAKKLAAAHKKRLETPARRTVRDTELKHLIK